MDNKLKVKYVICPKCGYNNKKERFSLYGTCLRCHRIIDKKIFIKRLLWEVNTKYKIYEEVVWKN